MKINMPNNYIQERGAISKIATYFQQIMKDNVLILMDEFSYTNIKEKVTEGVWLQSVHQLIQFLALFRSVGTHVKPKFGDGTVVGQQFGNLGFGEFMMLWGDEITVMAGDRIGLWKMPVYQ